MNDAAVPSLRRELGVFSALMLGLGSILGTGIFVSVGIAAGVAGPSVLLAIALAGALALCNALSSAQLAAHHPTSGGTYEYAHVLLSPSLGFVAGWTFLIAKSASAATAALGFAGYTLALINLHSPALSATLAPGAVALLTILVLTGLRRSSAVNALLVAVTLAALLCFILACAPAAIHGRSNFLPFFNSPTADTLPALPRLLEATALMFVAYTGYARIATLGEEVRSPRIVIPRAILLTLALSGALYLLVAAAAIGAAGAGTLASATQGRAAPLAALTALVASPIAAKVVAIGAIAAMLGVLLNLILGLSRVALAMARRADLPRPLARICERGRSSAPLATITVGAVILGLTLIGSVKLAWSFSACAVLIYYAITNLAALRLPRAQRLYHSAIAWIGLVGSLSLAFWVEPRVWITCALVIAAGFALRAISKRL